MELEGWNYKNAKPNGKNLFIFRDTCHVDSAIQDSLLRGLELAINRGFFHLLFSEGHTGNMQLRYDSGMSELDVKKVLSQKTGRYASAVEILSYRLQETKNNTAIIWGVESREHFKEQIASIKKIEALIKKHTAGIISPLEGMELDQLILNDGIISNNRTIHAAKNAFELMNEWKVDTAGIIFGEGHYELLTVELKKQGTGYISYFPGKQPAKIEDALNYIAKLREVK